MRTFHQHQLAELSRKAEASPRQRFNFNFHESESDPLQRMINCWTPEAYIRPHRHLMPTKREAWVLLQGKLVVIEFNSIGQIIQHAVMSCDDNMVVEINPGAWHTVIALEPQTLVYEIKDGPYKPDTDKEFAPWSPPEHSMEGSLYRDYLLKELGYFSFVFHQEYAF